MSGYKDDLQAAHERIASLEREVKQLRGKGSDEAPPAPRRRGWLVGSGLVALLAGGACLVGVVLLLQRVALLPVAALIAAGVLAGGVLLLLLARVVVVLRPWQAGLVRGMGERVAIGGYVIRLPLLQDLTLMDLRARVLDWSATARAGEDSFEARGHIVYAINPTDEDVQRAARLPDPSKPDAVVRLAVETATRDVLVEGGAAVLERDPTRVTQNVQEAVQDELHDKGLRVLSLGLEGAGVQR
jgi:uncharacterized membrane protein YqiK